MAAQILARKSGIQTPWKNLLPLRMHLVKPEGKLSRLSTKIPIRASVSRNGLRHDTVYVNKDKANQSAAGKLGQAMSDYYGAGANILFQQIATIDSAKRAVTANGG